MASFSTSKIRDAEQKIKQGSGPISSTERKVISEAMRQIRRALDEAEQEINRLRHDVNR